MRWGDDWDDPVDDWFSDDNRPNGGASWGTWIKPDEPTPVRATKESWPAPKPRTDLIFAKSCAPGNWCKTDLPTEPEPASNFGSLMIAGAMLMPSAETAIATALGIDGGLGRMAGGGILQRRMNWALRGAVRGATGPAGTFVMGMLPKQLADGTYYTDDQLRRLNQASTRVRFQFRLDREGVLRVYGIHTTASGDDSVRVVHAAWNADKTAIEAELDGVTILWTPREGPLGTQPLTYPDDSGAQFGTILVHPIPENTDSQIEGLPGNDVTSEDCIVVFPANTGMRSMYVVFARPVGGDHSYHPAPADLAAFPDAVRARKISSVKGGGKKRSRWKDPKGRIYEWDYENGRVELYDKQGKHLGEFDPNTGERTKDAEPGRTTPK